MKMVERFSNNYESFLSMYDKAAVTNYLFLFLSSMKYSKHSWSYSMITHPLAVKIVIRPKTGFVFSLESKDDHEQLLHVSFRLKKSSDGFVFFKVCAHESCFYFQI
jgi:hypothetical protein